MSRTFLLTLAVATLPLMGCVETPTTFVEPPITGGDLTGVPATACKAAIARATNQSPSDVAVFDVAESEAGVAVLATVAGAEAPWQCVSDSSGNIQGTMYTGSEGAL